MSDENEYIENADKHRFIFKALLLENADKAQPGEIVIDVESGTFYVKGSDGKLHSKAADTMAKLQELDDAGILQSALAYVNNAEVYTIYKKGNKIRLDESLKLSVNVRYYAIRGTNPDTGNLEYMTGNLNNGEVENSLVDVTHDTSSANSAYTGTATVGVLHTPSAVVEGKPYYIEMYNSDRVLVSSVPAQIVEVDSLNFALTPEYNCTRIEIATSQDTMDTDPQTGEQRPISYIYRGQSLSALEIWVSAIFANGDKKLINSDLASSRLVITLPQDADTNTVGNEFDITAKYYTEDVNIDDATDEERANYASLDATRHVKVVEDIFTEVHSLIPVPFIKKERLQSGILADQIDLRVFAFYKDNKLEDVSRNTRLTVSSDFDANTFDTTQGFKLALGLGNSGTQFEEDVTLLMGSSPHHQFRRFAIKSANWAMSETSPMLKTPVAQIDTRNNEFKNWMRLNANDAASEVDTYTANATQKGTLAAIKALGRATINNVVTEPTHFRVRSVIKPEFLHTPTPIDIADAVDGFEFVDTSSEQTLDSYVTTNNGIPYPVIVEFLKFDAETGIYTRLSVVPFFTTATTDFVEYSESVVSNGAENNQNQNNNEEPGNGGEEEPASEEPGL